MTFRYQRFLPPFLICTVIGAGIGFGLSAFVMFYVKHPGAPMDFLGLIRWLGVMALGTLPLRLFYTVTSQQYGIAWALVDNWVGIGAMVGLILGILSARRPAVGDPYDEE